MSTLKNPFVNSSMMNSTVWIDPKYENSLLKNSNIVEPYVTTSHDADWAVLMQRLSILRILPTPLISITVKRLTSGKRVILVTNDDQWVTFEDGPELYPSDTLVTAIGVILK